MRLTIPVLLLLVLVLAGVAHGQGVDVHSVVDTLLAKYRSAGQNWTGTIQNAATKFFWLPATISLGWTCISMAIKQSDLVEIVAELCRFIMFTGFSFGCCCTEHLLQTPLSIALADRRRRWWYRAINLSRRPYHAGYEGVPVDLDARKLSAT
jgi:hypothetical protein